MYKKIVLLIVLSPIAFKAYNQTAFKPETYFGVKVGGNVSMVSFDPSVDQGMSFGYVGGVSFKHISQKSLGVQLELNNLQCGWNEKLDSINSYSRKLNYLQIPFMTHVNTGKGKVRFVLNLGPYVSVLLFETERINLIEGEEEKFYYNKGIGNSFEYGLCFGIGLSVNTTKGLFQFESRISQSLSNIYKQEQESYFSSSKNQVLEVTLSYFPSFKKLKE